MPAVPIGGQRRRIAALLLAGLAAWLPAGAGAEPRPEPYGGGADHYADIRHAIRGKQWGEAVAALRRLEQTLPHVTQDAEFHNLMGFTLRQQNPAQAPEAIRHYLTALRLDPTHVQAREYLGQAYLLQGREDLALEQLRGIEEICKGPSCEAWQSLHRAMEAWRARR